jgi:hypothetical protein
VTSSMTFLNGNRPCDPTREVVSEPSGEYGHDDWVNCRRLHGSQTVMFAGGVPGHEWLGADCG